MRKYYNRNAQTVMEYVLILLVVLAALLSSGFVDNLHGICSRYFTHLVRFVSVMPGL